MVIPASVALGAGLGALGVPASWILGAIVASGTAALISGRDLAVSPVAYTLGRGFIGILAALPLTVSDPRVLGSVIPMGLAASLVTLAICIAGGLSLAVPRDTGILAMLPGGASVMPALADELGADYRYVALTQYLRLLIVSMTLPLVIGLMAWPAAAPAPPHASASPTELAWWTLTAQPWWLLLVVLGIAAIGERVGAIIHLPAAAVTGPLLLTVLVAAVLPEPYAIGLTEPMKIFAYLVIGWVCGGGLSLPALRHFGTQLPRTIVLIAVVMAACALSAWPVARLMDIAYAEAFLATSPGALETVLALSDEGGAGPVVVAFQITRLVCVLVIASALPQLLRTVDRLRRR